MREVDPIPNWLTNGLVAVEKKEEGKEQKQGGPERLWQKVDTGGQSMLVRSANKQKRSIPVRRV